MLACVRRLSSGWNLYMSAAVAGGNEMSDGNFTAETPENSKLEKKRRAILLGVIGIGVPILLAGIFGGNALIQDNKAEQAAQTAIALAATETQSVAQTETARPTPTPGIGSTLISEIDGMELVFVPEGTFLMGSTSADSDAYDDEFPQHEVYLDGYWIDKTEVTNAMYAAFLNERGNQSEGGSTWLDAGDEDVRIGQVNGTWQPDSGYADHPVVEVSWYGAAAYCEWAGRRLPTEAEWEKASRGTEGQIYPWGNYEITGDLANYCDTNCEYDDWKDSTENDGYTETAPVGSYPSGASPYGALDMAGNVWEWVADWYGGEYYDTSTASNPTGPATGTYRVLRGGSWYHPPSLLRSAYRLRSVPDDAWNLNGFRCARSQ